MLTLADVPSDTLARSTEVPSLVKVGATRGLLTLPSTSDTLLATPSVPVPCSVPARKRLLTPPSADNSRVAPLDTAKSETLDSEPELPPTSLPAATSVVPL